MNSSSVRKSKSGRKSAVSAAGLSQLPDAIQRLCYRRSVDRAILSELMALIKAQIPFEAATLYLITGEEASFEELISIGRPVEPLEFLPLGSGSGLSGWAAYSGKPILLRDRTRSSHFNPETDLACFLSVPLPLEEKPLGVLNLGSSKPGVMDEGHVDRIKELVTPLTVVLERVLYERAVAGATEALRQSQRRLNEAEDNAGSGLGSKALAGLVISLIHEINEQLSVIVGNVECLLVEPAIGNQAVLTRLRRVEEAALKLKTCSRKLLKFTQPRKSATMSTT